MTTILKFPSPVPNEPPAEPVRVFLCGGCYGALVSNAGAICLACAAYGPPEGR